MPYNTDFFNAMGSSARRSAKVVLPVVFDITGIPRSVLDVGCGTGWWLRTAKQLGVEEVHGIDGYARRERLEIETASFQTLDLARPVNLGRRFDLVVSLEVAEHLERDSAETFVESLTRHADVVLFSAAIPGQGGEAHINEQPATYWMKLFERQEFEVFDLVRPQIWKDNKVEFYYRQNALLFAIGGAADRLRGYPHPPPPVDIVHPALLAMYTEARVLSALNLVRASMRRSIRRQLPLLANRGLGNRNSDTPTSGASPTSPNRSA